MGEQPDGVLRVVPDNWVSQEHDSGPWPITASQIVTSQIAMPFPLLPDTPDLSSYIAGLPEASGEFTGYFDAGSPAAQAPESDEQQLIPVDIDTGDNPNPAVALAVSGDITFVIGGKSWRLPVVHVELPGSNRVRAWCRKPEVVSGA